MLSHTLQVKGGGKPVSMKLWLEAETGLPVKLTMTGGTSDVKELTETYGEFSLDTKVDPKTFELPKDSR